MAFGIYVHCPFCATRCSYCAFATWTDRPHLMQAYADACVASLDGAPQATSVFFGGGTPSLMPAPMLLSILSAVDLASGAEVTVECNPDTITPALLAAYRAGGVTRLSVGVQSLVPHVLDGLGRTHSASSVPSVLASVAAAGFESWSVDLIYGGFGESHSDWLTSVSTVIAMGAPHVSAYALTVEPGTPLAEQPARHPDDDVLASRYEAASGLFAAVGLANYEISNWAQPGHECRHNQLYWSQGSYLGIGCAAHSHADGRRWWNVRTPERFISLVSSGGSVEGGYEELSAEDRRIEGLRLSLRTPEGVPADALSAADGALLLERGLITVGGRGFALTVAGRLLANEVSVRLL